VPLPLLPDVIAIQSTLSEAVQLQVLGPVTKVTVMLPVPALEVKSWLAGEME
jgi:hypothetical protein